MISWRLFEYLLLAAAACVLALLVCTGVFDLLFFRRAVKDGRPRTRKKASRAFADAVARGEFEAADGIAAFLLSRGRLVHDRSDAGTSREARRLIQGRRDDLLTWDEDRLLAISIDEVRRQFTDLHASAIWFPDIVRVARDGHPEVVIGRTDPIRLRILSETWTSRPDTLSFTAACPTVQINGTLGFRTVVSGRTPSGEILTAVEVWIHMDATGSVEGRQALARTRTIANSGLDRMATVLGSA